MGETTVALLPSQDLEAGISYEGIRIESYPMPEPALREAVVNAIVHRDCAVGAPIQIRVYAERLSIWNPGELPENWSRTRPEGVSRCRDGALLEQRDGQGLVELPGEPVVGGARAWVPASDVLRHPRANRVYAVPGRDADADPRP
jgi:hypothetical protein